MIDRGRQSRQARIRERLKGITRMDIPVIAAEEPSEGKKGIANQRRVLQEEEEWVLERRRACGFEPGNPEEDSVGLSLSGGGIRSATFNLGILQAMERFGPPSPEGEVGCRFLEKVDYLSTVSGGGYIGSCLTWLMSCTGEFPFGVSRRDNVGDPGKEPPLAARIVAWLRGHGEYLTPGDGLNRWALACAILRGIALNLLVFLPLIFLVVLLFCQKFFLDIPGLFPRFPGLIRPWLIHVSDWFPKTDGFQAAFFLGLTAFATLGIFFFVYGLLSNLMTHGTTGSPELRDSVLKCCGRVLRLAVYAVVVGSVPLVSELIQTHAHTWWRAATSSFSLSGAVSVYLAWRGRSGSNEARGGRHILANAGLALLLFGMILWMYNLGVEMDIRGHWKILLFLTGASLILLIFANVNNLSLHRFYRDRLISAFMPDPNVGLSGTPQSECGKPNAFRLKDIKRCSCPYHIINTNLMTLDSSEPTLKARGGENFVLSALYCGSDHTGYVRTKDYAGGGMDLATAFSISGAAVEPNTGVTRSRPLAFLMSLLNIRLGYWTPNPRLTYAKVQPVFGSHFLSYTYVFNEMIGRGLNEDQWYVHLSDGGHFENLGLYELIRRKIRNIVVCDAGADPEWTFGDLARACELVRVDFGAEIDIDTRPLHPRPPKRSGQKFRLSDVPFVHGTVKYADGSTGRMLFIKTCLVDGLGADIYGYRRVNPTFPDQTTMDQFFDERQFEAYRELGFQIGRLAFEGKTLKEVFTPSEKKGTGDGRQPSQGK